MLLNTREWGEGERITVLVHGMMGDSRCWWEIGPALARRGHRVIAVDLPGHGDSPSCPEADVEMFAASLLESVPAGPALAIGHSLGGSILGAAVDRLKPGRAVYVDTPFRSGRSRVDTAALATAFAKIKADRTTEKLRRDRPWWHERDIAAEVEAATRFDVATMVSLHASRVGVKDNTPPVEVPSLMIRPDPSGYVPPEVAEKLRTRGFEVRSIPGVGHSVWYGHHEEFMTALKGWL